MPHHRVGTSASNAGNSTIDRAGGVQNAKVQVESDPLSVNEYQNQYKAHFKRKSASEDGIRGAWGGTVSEDAVLGNPCALRHFISKSKSQFEMVCANSRYSKLRNDF